MIFHAVFIERASAQVPPHLAPRSEFGERYLGLCYLALGTAALCSCLIRVVHGRYHVCASLYRNCRCAWASLLGSVMNEVVRGALGEAQATATQ